MAAIGCSEKKCKHCFSGSVGPKVSKKCIVFQISKNSERKVKKLHSELDYIVKSRVVDRSPCRDLSDVVSFRRSFNCAQFSAGELPRFNGVHTHVSRPRGQHLQKSRQVNFQIFYTPLQLHRCSCNVAVYY